MSISIFNPRAIPERQSDRVMPEPVQIRAVRTAKEVAAFIDFPKMLFRDQPHWVDPLDLEVKRFISRSHPFRAHGDAQLFAAYREGVLVGRLMASDDPNFNDQHQSNWGCFGMFHCIDDQEVADHLLDAAAHWVRKKGRTRLLGPIDYSTNYATGLLVDGFDSPPRVLMNHHPRYYQRLLKNWGLSKAKDLYAWWFTRNNSIDDQWRTRVKRMAERFGVNIRSIRMNDFDNEIALCRQLYNEAWADNWGFVRMTRLEFDDLAHSLRKFAVPEMMLIAEVKRQPVGLAITMPDLNEAIAPLKGRLTRLGLPIGLARLMVRMHRVKTARLAALGVVPRYRRRGVAEMLILHTFDYGKDKLGYTGAELSWTLEDNDMINRAICRVGGKCYKTYRIFERDLPDATSPARLRLAKGTQGSPQSSGILPT